MSPTQKTLAQGGKNFVPQEFDRFVIVGAELCESNLIVAKLGGYVTNAYTVVSARHKI
jgi:hypothetical protein